MRLVQTSTKNAAHLVLEGFTKGEIAAKQEGKSTKDEIAAKQESESVQDEIAAKQEGKGVQDEIAAGQERKSIQTASCQTGKLTTSNT